MAERDQELPFSDRGDVDGVVDPASIGEGSDGGDATTNSGIAIPPRRRGGWPKGKPRGSRAAGDTAGGKSKNAAAALDLDGLSALLVMIHAGLAQRAGPHWLMPEDEAKRLMTAAGNVMRHYHIAATQKMVDIGALVTIACASYLPRIVVHVGESSSEMRHVA